MSIFKCVNTLVIRNQPSLADFTCPSLTNITTLWLENVGTTVDTMSIVEALRTGARVRIFGFAWNVEEQSDISDMLDILDNMRGLDQNGDNVDTAQVYGSIHVPSVTGALLAHAKARYPDITITYDHVSATITYLDNDGTQLGTETVLDGAAPTHVPSLSNKEDSQYYYTFLGWGSSASGSVDEHIFDDTTADKTVYAIYRLTEKIFTVRFYNGTELLATYNNVSYGATIDYNTIPTYNGVGNPGDYQFTGWSPVPENITADTDCYAQFLFVGMYFRQYMNDTLTEYADTNNLVSIASYAFAGLSSLEAISMPVLGAIPERCFAGCTSLETVDLPSVVSSSEYAFTYSEAMEKIYLPELIVISGVPFVNAISSLKEVRLPKNTSSMRLVLSGCNYVEILDIGVVDAIGVSYSGSGYSHFTYFIMRNTSQVVTPYDSTVFNANSPIANGTGKILVPRSMVASYKADSNWGKFAAVIEAIEDNPSIANPS